SIQVRRRAGQPPRIAECSPGPPGKRWLRDILPSAEKGRVDLRARPRVGGAPRLADRARPCSPAAESSRGGPRSQWPRCRPTIRGIVSSWRTCAKNGIRRREPFHRKQPGEQFGRRHGAVERGLPESNLRSLCLRVFVVRTFAAYLGMARL